MPYTRNELRIVIWSGFVIRSITWSMTNSCNRFSTHFKAFLNFLIYNSVNTTKKWTYFNKISFRAFGLTHGFAVKFVKDKKYLDYWSVLMQCLRHQMDRKLKNKQVPIVRFSIFVIVSYKFPNEISPSMDGFWENGPWLKKNFNLDFLWECNFEYNLAKK